MYAVRTVRLCTKDCLCLYVCPTGAADTENSIIDREKCTGCGACADACPSGAISLVPEEFPPQQPKTEAVAAGMRTLAYGKVIQENQAADLAGDYASSRLAKALEMSNRIMAEDILREAGYMLPQSKNTHVFLKSLQEAPVGDDFPKEAVEQLLALITPNE
ncbi:MAG: 4Fe-4S binding protein [Raoultibacter sp.]